MLLLLYFNKSTQNEDLQLSRLENVQSSEWWNKTKLADQTWQDDFIH